MRITVTGAAGFVGSALCSYLSEKGYKVTGIIRDGSHFRVSETTEVRCVEEIGPKTDWSNILLDEDAVIHLAARTHIKDASKKNAEKLYHKINVDGTLRLAKSAMDLGVKKFVYISSVKAMGEQSGVEPLNESFTPKPEDYYGLTKLRAERELLGLCSKSDMKVIIVRPPLIYGPGVKGNFLSLMKVCQIGLPLPFKTVKNKRSIIFLGNFTDILTKIIETNIPSGECFLVSDGESVSTAELVARISFSLGKSPNLFFMPISILTVLGTALGQKAAIERLTGSLEIEDSKIKKMLGWAPPFNMLQGLEITAKWFQDQKKA